MMSLFCYGHLCYIVVGLLLPVCHVPIIWLLLDYHAPVVIQQHYYHITAVSLLLYCYVTASLWVPCFIATFVLLLPYHNVLLLSPLSLRGALALH